MSNAKGRASCGVALALDFLMQCMCTCMYTGAPLATKTITIDMEAYKRLKAVQKQNESFSQTINASFGTLRASRSGLPIRQENR